MKRILLAFAATMMLCLGIHAQNQYVMKILKTDGTTLEINVNDIQDVTFDEIQDPFIDVPHHFDLTVTVGKQGGMGRDVTTIMQSRTTLDGGPTVDFKNMGAEINADYSMEMILKGKYYYQVPVSADRFVKLQFVNNKMEVVQAQPFRENTYNTRQYCHAWTGDNTLIIMAANGDKNAIVWTKLNTDDMSIISEGTLSLQVAEGYDSFTTSGILAYRESDNKLFYFYYCKKGSGRTAKNEPNFHLVAFSDTEIGEEGKLLRISKGNYNFDAGYNGFPNSDGKLLTTQYLGNGKVFTYSRNDALTEDDGKGGTRKANQIDSYSHYYSVIDLNANTRTRMAVNGSDIDYSSGRFSQRSAFDRGAGKVFFGVNTQNAAPCVYVYDVATGAVTKGVDVAEGYYFEQIRLVED